MSKQIFEEKGGPHRGHAAGATDLEKQASQLASDVKYKVKKSMSGMTRMNPAQVAKAYLAQLAKSPAPSAVKALAKKKLMPKPVSEQFNSDDIVEKSLLSAFNKVFVEGIEEETEEENDYLLQLEAVEEKKYKVRVTDKKTGNSYVRMATRAKIAELRANPNIASVEMTQYGEPSESEKKGGKQTAKAKAGKGLDPVGQEDKDVDNDGDHDKSDKYLLKRRAAVGSAIAKRKKVAEEFLVDGVKSENNDAPRKVEGVKNGKKNKVVVFPEIKEQKQEDDQEKDAAAQQNQQQKFQKKQLSSLDRLNKEKFRLTRKIFDQQRKGQIPFGSIASQYEPEGEQIDEKITAKTDMGAAIKDFYASKSPQLAGRTKEERRKAAIAAVLTARRGGKKLGEEACGCEDEKEPKLKKSEGGVEDPREIPTKVNMVKNKLRSMGLKMSYELEGDQIDEIAMNPNSRFTTSAQRRDYAANQIGSREFSDRGGYAALKAGGGQAALKRGSSVSDVLHAGKRALQKPITFNRPQLNQPKVGAVKPMNSFAAGGGNAKMKATGMTKDQVIALGKKNLSSSYEPEGDQIDEIAPLVAGGLALGSAALAGAAIKRAQDAAKSGVNAANRGQSVKPGIGIGNAAYGMQKRNNALNAAMKQLRQSYEPEGESIDELNRYEKEKGINTKTGKPTASGGAKADKAFIAVKKTIRGMEGTPAGQRKKVPGKKPPAAGQYGAPRSPAQKVAMRRAAAQRAQDAMHSRFD